MTDPFVGQGHRAGMPGARRRHAPATDRLIGSEHRSTRGRVDRFDQRCVNQDPSSPSSADAGHGSPGDKPAVRHGLADRHRSWGIDPRTHSPPSSRCRGPKAFRSERSDQSESTSPSPVPHPTMRRGHFLCACTNAAQQPRDGSTDSERCVVREVVNQPLAWLAGRITPTTADGSSPASFLSASSRR